MNLRYALLVCVFVLSVAPSSVQAITCSDQSQSHPASAAEAVNGIKVGDPVCPADAQGGITADAGAAKQYLYSISTKTNTADQEHINKLNSTFAVCAAAYAKAYTQTFGEALQITSAWRSQADQARVSTSPTSNHTRGLAIDIHPASRSQASYDRMLDFAAQNKQFGVCFARPSYNGSPDRPHMTAAGIGSRTEDCAKYGITKLCNEGGTFDPNQVSGGEANQGAASTPTSGFSDMLRQYMGGQKPATGATPAGNSIPASSQPYTASQPTTIASPASGGSTGSTGATTPGGTSVTTAVPATIATGNTAQPTNVSDQLTTSQPSGSSNAYDLLNAIANPTTTRTSSTGTPIVLNGSLYQVQQITQTQQVQYDANGQPIALNGSLSNVSALGPNGQQTFTSQDLQYTQSNSYVVPTNTSFAQRTLETLKQALLKLLSILKPFGYVRPQIAPEDATE